MSVYKIRYTADGKSYSMIMSAKDENAAKKKCNKFFKNMGFKYAHIDSIKVVD